MRRIASACRTSLYKSTRDGRAVLAAWRITRGSSAATSWGVSSVPVFLQFRLWLTQGAVRERVYAGAAAALVVVLLVLASLPLTDDDGAGDVADGALAATGDGVVAADGTTGEAGTATPGVDPAAGGAALGGTTGAATSSGAGSATVAGGDTGDDAATSTAGATTGECAGLTASAPGITAEELVVGASIVNLAGPVGNAAFSIRPDTHQVVDAVVEDINRNGGVACGRKLVVKKYDVNPIDENDQRTKCLQMVQDKVFAVLDFAGYARPVGRTCFVQNQLPHQISTSSTEVDFRKGFPYLYGEPASSEKQARDGILGLAEVGFFQAPGFKKLGLLVDTCDPSVGTEIQSSLDKVGVGAGQVSKFTVNCALVAPPNEILQGVVQHKAAGASHVFLASSLSNNQRYTSLAQQQGFRPAYGVSDYGTATASNGTWDRSFAGAIGVTSTRRAEMNSGIKNPRVQTCERLVTAKGLKGFTNDVDSASNVCDQFWFFRKAVDRAGANPTRTSLVEVGVGSIGQHESGGGSDGIFDRRGKVNGGDFYRFLQFDGGCVCWKLRDPNFKRGH